MTTILGRFIFIAFGLLGGAAGVYGAVSPGLSIVSGNGQVVYESSLRSEAMVVQARDAQGNPVPNLPVTWTITSGQGTLVGAIATTDNSGFATAYFVGSGIMQGYSYTQQTITAKASVRQAVFYMTTIPLRTPSGTTAPPPIAPLLTPEPGQALSGPAGSILAAAVQTQVIALSGIDQGHGIPNVGMQIVNGTDPSAPSPAVCANGEGGTVLTDANGKASCDLQLTGPPGTYSVVAWMGEFVKHDFQLQITPGAACTYTLSVVSQSFGANGGAGSAGLTAPQGCAWTASTTAPWITITSGNSGSGNGTVSYTVSANTGAARTGVVSVAGQSLTVSQAAAGTSSGISITTAAALPSATAGAVYAVTLGATGGQAPYTWSLSGTSPAGLTLNPGTGVLSGTPGNAGSYNFQATVRDAAGQTATQGFTLSVQPAGSGGPGQNPVIANTSFPNAAVGQAYQQTLNSTGGCSSPFAAPPVYSVYSGALPPGLAIQAINDRQSAITGTPTAAGTFSFALLVTACGRTGQGSFSIFVSSTPGAQSPLSATPASVLFSYQNSALADQTISLSSSAPLAFTAAVNPGTGGNWLTIAAASSGTTPSAITLHLANYAALSPGTYSSSLVITPVNGQAPLYVPVNLVIASGGQITVTPKELNFLLAANNGAASLGSQTLQLQTQGGTVGYSTNIVAATGGTEWLTVSKTGGIAPDTLIVKADATQLSPGNYSGFVGITPAGAGALTQLIRVAFQVVAPPVFQLSPASLTFSATAGGGTPAQQTVSVASSSAAAPFLATPSAAWLTVTPAQGITPQALAVGVNAAGLAPGAYNAEITIASVNPGTPSVKVPVTFVLGGAQPAITSVVNGASFLPGAIAPGELVTIFGSSMGPASLTLYTLTPGGRIDTTLAGTQVFFDDTPAPVFYTRADQVTVIAPFTLAGRTSTNVQVRYNGQPSASVSMAVAGASPGIFTAGGTSKAAALNQDLSVNTEQNGAEPGSIVVLYLTGAGQTEPSGTDGAFVADASFRVSEHVSVQVNGIEAPVLYAGGAPGMPAGMTQMNVQLPPDLPRGVPATVSVSIGSSIAQPGVTVFVKP